ncbi:Nitrite reductase [Trichinella pseudospiralis]
MQYSGIEGVSKEAAEIMAHAAELFCADLMKKSTVITDLYERHIVMEKDVNLCSRIYPSIASMQDSVNEMWTESLNRIQSGVKEDANEDVIQEPRRKMPLDPLWVDLSRKQKKGCIDISCNSESQRGDSFSHLNCLLLA